MQRNCIFIAIMLLASSAKAGPVDPLLQKLRGEYNGTRPWSATLRTITIGEDSQAVAAEILVGSPGCSGAFAGIGTSDGKVLQIRPYKPSSNESGQCVLTVKLDKSGKKATISEDGCSNYHGAQCEFSGSLSAK